MHPRSIHSPEYQLLARWLRERRIANKLTQEEVANELGKPRSFTHKVETADRELNVIELMDYCAAIGENFFEFVVKLGVAVQEMRAEREQDQSSP